MKVGLYNLEPRYPNLALEKVRCFYGDRAEYCSPLESSQYDIVYASSIFDWTSKQYVVPNMLIGGTGFDLTTKLPPEIDAIIPRINRGFTTRGCIRNCPFCVVPKKEGLPVASATSPPAGYFIAVSWAEKREYEVTTKSRLIGDAVRLKEFKRAASNFLSPQGRLI